jgi:hypothetical protein
MILPRRGFFPVPKVPMGARPPLRRRGRTSGAPDGDLRPLPTSTPLRYLPLCSPAFGGRAQPRTPVGTKALGHDHVHEPASGGCEARLPVRRPRAGRLSPHAHRAPGFARRVRRSRHRAHRAGTVDSAPLSELTSHLVNAPIHRRTVLIPPIPIVGLSRSDASPAYATNGSVRCPPMPMEEP